MGLVNFAHGAVLMIGAYVASTFYLSARLPFAAAIHVGRSNAIAFAIGASLAALAGGLVGPMLYVSPTIGDSLGIQGFAAAILGGFGSIPGAIVGGLGIGVIGSFAAQSFQGYSDLVTCVVFTVLVLIRPTGLFG